MPEENIDVVDILIDEVHPNVLRAYRLLVDLDYPVTDQRALSKQVEGRETTDETAAAGLITQAIDPSDLPFLSARGALEKFRARLSDRRAGLPSFDSAFAVPSAESAPLSGLAPVLPPTALSHESLAGVWRGWLGLKGQELMSLSIVLQYVENSPHHHTGGWFLNSPSAARVATAPMPGSKPKLPLFASLYGPGTSQSFQFGLYAAGNQFMFLEMRGSVVNATAMHGHLIWVDLGGGQTLWGWFQLGRSQASPGESL